MTDSNQKFDSTPADVLEKIVAPCSHETSRSAHAAQVDAFLDDGAIAQTLCVSKSCIRGQRFKRRHGLPHWFTVDPVYIGKCPRYRASDCEAWLASLPVRPNGSSDNTEAA